MGINDPYISMKVFVILLLHKTFSYTDATYYYTETYLQVWQGCSQAGSNLQPSEGS